ncbi:cytochrome P450 [Rhodovibrionaceae bacterium A322]
MARPKYYAKIEEAQRREQLQPTDVDRLTFDLAASNPRTLFEKLKARVTSFGLPLLLTFLRRFFPRARFKGVVWLTRHADVCEVLEKPDVFKVPFGLEMKEMAGGVTFALGSDAEDHHRQREIMLAVMKPEDHDRVRETTRKVSEALLRDSGGQIDVMRDLITRVATETCLELYGLESDDPDGFADWAMAVTALLFADYYGQEVYRQQALIGAARLRRLLTAEIRKVTAQKPEDRRDTLLARMIALREADVPLQDGSRPSDTLTEAGIRAIFFGMVTGFVPTNTMAAGHLLEVVLGRRKVLRQARSAAANGDKAQLEKVLFEAARFKPGLLPGQLRYVDQDCVIGQGRGKPYRVRKGEVVLAATASAVKDPRALQDPKRFNPDRPALDPNLMFGVGLHDCIGQHLARLVITETLFALFNCSGLELAAGKLKVERAGPFPRHLQMTFVPAEGQAVQTLSNLCLPLKQGADPEAARAAIRQLGHPASPALRKALDATGVVHFASLLIVDVGDPDQPDPRLLIELSVDGTLETALRAIVQEAEALLKPVLAFTEGIERAGNLATFLAAHHVPFHRKPWGAIGLNYPGMTAYSVAQVERENALFSHARERLAAYQAETESAGDEGAGDRPWAYLQRLRRELRADPKWSDLFYRPSGRRLGISQYRERTLGQAIGLFLASAEMKRRYAWLAGLVALLTVGLYCLTSASLLSAFMTSVGSFLFLALALVAGFAFLLRRHEERDEPDLRAPSQAHMDRLKAIENHPGYAQNHITSVSDLKPGWFRKVTLALALEAIYQEVVYWFRPGYVVDMGTIHYARWFRLPGTEKLIFQSNFDGSWESYLEDFVSKASEGQTAAWSNAVGFPKSRWMMYGGAADADGFKRWVRRQQVDTQCWYSRFPELTTDQIHSNALVRDGLARARSSSAAKAWLSYFGSLPRPLPELQGDEIQTLVFGGLGKLKFGQCFALKITDATPARKLLADLRKGTRGGLKLSFGQEVPDKTALTVAFSASGLTKLGLPGPEASEGLGAFPSAFVQGMASRGKIVGDQDQKAWGWHDNPASEQGSDLVLLLYCDNEENLKKQITALKRKLSAGKLQIAQNIDLTSLLATGLKEPFGFRDGVSQPVLEGTLRADKGGHFDDDLVKPGEFILGYRDNRGYYPPSPALLKERDPHHRLAMVSDALPLQMAEFGADDLPRHHDFGRNGSYLVIRQLEQDVKGFHAFTAKTAKALNASAFKNHPVTQDWLEAKMVGRWKDGSSLVRYPDGPAGIVEASARGKAGSAKPDAGKGLKPDNDFRFGEEDPQGLRCPLGAHIRRANPRESFKPGSEEQVEITSRHRILRRGRRYQEGEKEGLLFMCLNANLERQFEFVQQTWINSPAFDVLRDEVDPLLPPKGSTTSFSIPHEKGGCQIQGLPSFVTMKGGGYFFLPGRGAVDFLCEEPVEDL